MSTNLSQTKNGKVFRCLSCNKIHIEFNNINFNFKDEDYRFFTDYIESIDGSHWELVNSKVNYKRKIIVPLGYNSINFLLNNEELKELQFLLKNANINNTIKFVQNFEYSICYN